MPGNVVFTEALLKTITGKILKRDMRQTYADLSKYKDGPLKPKKRLTQSRQARHTQ